MDKIRLSTPKGFRDFLPPDSLKRKFVLDKIISVFEKFGFDPLETPTLEYAETLRGKYGEEEKLIYQFTSLGGDELALKYDQTVPLARVIAQYGPNGSQKIILPFKRYQLQSAFRGENTQKGRYREFLQCDVDIVGSLSQVADTEILALAYEVYQSLGLEVILKVNDRSLLQDIEPKYLSSIDKLNKIGKDGVLNELGNKGLSTDEATRLLTKINSIKPSEHLQTISNYFNELGYPKEILEFDPTLVRGLNYYTGLIFEVVLKSNLISSSLGGGGRYDNLIGMFANLAVPAVGFSVGLDRTIEALEEAGQINVPSTQVTVLVTIFSKDLAQESANTASLLRAKNINTDLWLDLETKLDKQLKYADQKGIPYAVIIGPEEAENKQFTLKDLIKQTQEKVSLEELVNKLGP
ncbi:histidine--tRNA ligase [Candidatus Daviesbacteria bacterium RIFCSPLOWO2_02_FULL_40_8]|uniref:Histidine--tRNA ligase n=1 Tax=Candidatus Daviesbacteria bacterium RIFCSPLOWO2_01_FULL_40_24 TaxID=1797787 RepID=A0A1F5MK37_9BACT|nr:MAG: histidine--tRNA ligase [Candidatus Daviesbacteria bacterium RIFCSPHIGHO2_01_FULL_41_45]OGE35039.1 MAG: histidine--tRNA ligase [Candidatus Daviesbacteria bacterium RIFCSPHIGHO2_02_FULL_41_14]OGE65746.1 MAG: histidine--tRNA ligase [Candidatus Daviesbacteria bacterium RIFCSPLOWO2_01_FULL_40_24]OGE67068.1 MAG: histidine--tRNA ligase [Candidatus Daviesbacteria bacterium RIFCSPLOWO2_02_FULL_40_8]